MAGSGEWAPISQVSDLAAGSMAGEYQVERKLAEGAMGAVYAAVHPIIGKRVAVKVVHGHLCGSPEAVERFVQEARAVNQIGHANIVDIFAIGELVDGRRYLVMEWLQGESLATTISRGTLPVTEAADILIQVCRALEAAHAKGIIHRDIKPDNVFLVRQDDERTVVKLLDFGIAKLLSTELSPKLTQTGFMVGTPAYLSPEQARGQYVDHRTDIYALGVMAFEMLTGRVPFEAPNTIELVTKHLQDSPPDPRSIRPDLPPPLAELVLRMLEKDAAARPSLADCRGILARVRDESTSAIGDDDLLTSVNQAGLAGGRSAPSVAPANSIGLPIRVLPRSLPAVTPQLDERSAHRASRFSRPRKVAAAGIGVALVAAGAIFAATRGQDPDRREPTSVSSPASPPSPAPPVVVVRPLAPPTPTPTALPAGDTASATTARAIAAVPASTKKTEKPSHPEVATHRPPAPSALAVQKTPPTTAATSDKAGTAPKTSPPVDRNGTVNPFKKKAP